MANIEMTPELSDAIRHRLTREYGEVCTTNFALDIMVEALQIELIKTREHVEALQERVQKQDAIIQQQLLDLGSRAAVQKQAMREHAVERAIRTRTHHSDPDESGDQ